MTHGLPARKLTLPQRFVVWGMNVFSRVGYGISSTFHEDYVRTYGAVEYIKWLGEAFNITKELERRFGAVEAQMIISMAGLWTGCRWCSTAHMLISNLMIFKSDDELGPIDELELARWQELTDPEVLDLLEHRLEGRWAHMMPLVRRAYALRTGEVEPETDDDHLLARANVMWEWVIECTITGFDMEPETIPAWGSVGSDRKLIARYRRARRERTTAP